MSSISGSGSSTQGILQYLQSLQASQSASQTPSATDSTSSGNASNALQALGGGHRHRGGGKGGGASAFFSQIQTAVTSALQSAQSSGSTTDPNQTIQNAIEQVFKNLQNGSTATGSASTASNSSSAASGSTRSTDGSGSTQGSAFAQLLQANGVDPEQFHSDFLSAIQSAQSGGSPDASSVFSGFPTGSAVDTIA
jgi:hypothetical protein